MQYWWPAGHIIGWEHTFVHELAHLFEAIAQRRRHRTVRSHVRGRLPGSRSVRRDRRRRTRAPPGPHHVLVRSAARFRFRYRGTLASREMRITDLKCAVIGDNPVVRVVTDASISGYAAAESLQAISEAARPVLQALHPGRGPRLRLSGSCSTSATAGRSNRGGQRRQHYRDGAMGCGRQKPRAARFTACWAARSATVCASGNGAVRFPMTGYSPQDYAENMARMRAAPEGFSLIKQGVGFHSPMAREVPDFYYGTPQPDSPTWQSRAGSADRKRPQARHRMCRSHERRAG